MKKNSKTRIGGGEHRSLSQQPSGFTPILGFRKSETLKKKGFTLAEVLITLAIIGVVAALTIPVVVAKYQKAQYYTQFMKVYNTLSEALSLAQADNGPYKSWSGQAMTGTGEIYIDRTKSIESNFISNLKVAKMCESAADCGISDDMTMSLLNYTPEYDPLYPGSEVEYYKDIFHDSEEDGAGQFVFILNDGALVSMYYDRYTLDISIDTNGIKGPNVVGRDIFFLTGTDKNDNGILTIDGNGRHNQKTLYPEYFDTSEKYTNCTTKYESDGYNCALRLLVEHKMSY